MASDYMIGATSGTMVSLDELTTPLPNPQPVFREFVEMERLGNMSMRGAGPQTVIWKFPILDTTETTELESHKSASPIYIQTKDRFDVVRTFEVYMNWLQPSQDGEHMPGFPGYRGGLEIEFVVLSEVVGS